MKTKILKITSVIFTAFLMAFVTVNILNGYYRNSSQINLNSDYTDAEILEIIITIDQNEIAAAEVARKKSLSTNVLDYADMMNTEHSANMQQANKLVSSMGLTIPGSKEAAALKQKGSDELSKLNSLEGAEFESAYIDAMIKGHTEVLDMIDTKLLRDASDESLKAFLTETRSQVSNHLEAARKIAK